MDPVEDLVSYFSGELDRHIDHPDPRTRLDELLRSRPPAPIPLDIVTKLHHLLNEEAAARPLVHATELPRLGDQYAGLGALAAASLWQGDITMLSANALVNSANPNLLGCFTPMHECIDHAIHRAAGPGLRAECATIMRTQRGGQPPGSVKTTAAYHLRSRHVMHTVRPRIDERGVSAADLESLGSCFHSCLRAAALIGDRSIALPTVGAGAQGFSPADTADVMLQVLDTWLSHSPHQRVVINTFTDESTEAFRHRIAARATAP